MAWTEERKLAASEAAKLRLSAKHQPDAAEAPVGAFEEKDIVSPALEEEKPLEAVIQSPLLEQKPDLSKLNDDDKMQSILNLLKVLPEQYRQNRDMLKENVYNLARFTPTDAMLDTVLDGAYVAPQRFPN